MVERIRMARPFRAFFAWLSRGHRLTAFYVITALIAAAGLVYGVVNDRSQTAAEKRATEDRAAFYACVPKYVSDLSRTNLPRTIASIEASTARFNWDVGFDKHHPSWDKARLKAEYIRLYRAYLRVVVSNPPLPAFSAKYCEANLAHPSLTPSPAKTTKSHPKSKSGSKSPAASPNAGSSPIVQGARGGSTSPSKHTPGHSGSTSKPPSGPGSSPPLPGILLPGLSGAQTLICAALPVVCGIGDLHE